jgi:hypothetical protein
MMNRSLLASPQGRLPRPSFLFFSSVVRFSQPVANEVRPAGPRVSVRGEYKLQTAVVDVESLGAGRNRLMRQGIRVLPGTRAGVGMTFRVLEEPCLKVCFNRCICW